MRLRHAYDEGTRRALALFRVNESKIAALVPSMKPPALNSVRSSATAMPSALPKPATPPTAPLAAGAEKANVLG